MTFAVQEAWEIGLLQIPCYPGEPLFYVFWATLLIGILIQFLLLKKTKRPLWRRLYLYFLLAGLLACEVGCQVITGWDRLLPLVGWWLFLTLLLGAGLGTLLRHLALRRQS